MTGNHHWSDSDQRDEQTSHRVGFESPFPVAVSQIGPGEWELTCDLVYHGRTQTWTIPAGTATDFASIPRMLTWIVPSTTGIAAAAVHDYLWRHAIPAGEVTYRDADGILRQALRTLGVKPLKRWLMWAAVRWAALLRPGGHRGWWRDAPAVLGVSAVSLPLTLPAVLLLPPLVAYWLLEQVVSAPGRIRKARG